MALSNKEKLRILQIGPLPPPIGGMATLVQNLVETLQGRVETRVLNNAKTTRADRPLWAGVLAQLKLLLRLTVLCILWRPQLVHIHTCSYATFWRNCVDVLLVRVLGRKVVVHLHGGLFSKFLASLGVFKATMARGIFRLCHKVIVLGEGWRSRLIPWAGKDRIAVVPNGVALSEQKAQGNPDQVEIICLARYELEKGQSDLIRAVAGMDTRVPVRLALLGDEAEAGQKQELERWAEKEGITGICEIPGPVMGKTKEARLRNADIFCLPSYNEGLPISMLEAMATGLPVVVTRVGAIPEVIHHEKDGLLIDPGDVENLRTVLRLLVEDPAKRRAIGMAGRALVQRKYNVNYVADQCLLIYDTLTSG